MNRFLKFLLSLSTVAMTTILPIAANDGHEAVAAVLPAWSVIPFIGMFLSFLLLLPTVSAKPGSVSLNPCSSTTCRLSYCFSDSLWLPAALP